MKRSAARTGPRGIGRHTTGVVLLITTAIIGIVVGSMLMSSARPFRALAGGTSSGGGITEADGHLTSADGLLPDGVTVFDTSYPGVTKLDPDLLRALRAAAAYARRTGITLYVNSGWRSPNYQKALLNAAVSHYGSEQKAALWVATVDTSAHVAGDAADVGHTDAARWLSEHGARFGLCQIYRNEPWHFELRRQATSQGCPTMYADPTHDPRMHT